jgi:hypothetical protein
VTIGSANEKNVVILSGLEVGERVLMAAASYRDDLIDLPQVRPETLDGLSLAAKEQPARERGME